MEDKIQYTYERDFKSNREDGRFTESLAAFSEYLRNYKQILALPDNLTKDSFFEWKEKVRQTLSVMLAMPEFQKMPKYGLTPEEFFEYTGTDAPDHSFRKEVSIAFLKKLFGIA